MQMINFTMVKLFGKIAQYLNKKLKETQKALETKRQMEY